MPNDRLLPLARGGSGPAIRFDIKHLHLASRQPGAADRENVLAPGKTKAQILLSQAFAAQYHDQQQRQQKGSPSHHGCSIAMPKLNLATNVARYAIAQSAVILSEAKD